MILNNLKIINDTKGHSKGDQLIFNFARLLRNVIPKEAFVGRYGGDEFMVVIYNTSKMEIEDILKQLSMEKDQIKQKRQPDANRLCMWMGNIRC